MKIHSIRKVYHDLYSRAAQGGPLYSCTNWRFLALVGILLVVLLSACQPIRPEAQKSTQPTDCSEQKKIDLFREAVANVFNTGDFTAVVNFYAADGALIVDIPPTLDAATGTYTVTGQWQGKGPNELMDMAVGSHETKVKMTIDQIHVEGNSVIAQMTGLGAWYQEMGMPTDTAHPIFTVEFNADCKAQVFTVTYPDEFLQTLQ